GIPTMKDRAMQALYLLALEPIAETAADPNSYGFRPKRSTADALQQCFNVLCRACSPQWVLEGDIKAFRYTLMNVIVDSQSRNNLGVLKVNPAKFVRQDSVREIRQINYADYTERFVLPYLIKTGRVTSREQVLANTDLTQSTELLRNNPKIRVQICEDDFLLTPADLPWFRSTFGSKLTDYLVGGHLGNLHIPAVQEALAQLFSDKAKEMK